MMDKLSIGEYATGIPNFTLSGGSSQVGISGYQYSLNNSDPYSAYNSNSKPTLNTEGVNHVSGRVVNTHSIGGPAEISEVKLDNTPPTGTLTIVANNSALTATVTVNDTLSGPKAIYGYKVSTSNICDNTTTGFINNNSNTYNFTITSSGQHYVCARISDEAGNYNYISKVAPSNYFEYTGESQSFIATEGGYYKIEAWGAQGGGFDPYAGGIGGYTSGYINLNQNDNLYVYVGGEGLKEESVTNAGGWNGGGYSGNNSSSYSAGGGGATDIRLTNGAWNNDTSLNSRIMVAGGGGGAAIRNNGTDLVFTPGNATGLIGQNGTGSYVYTNAVDPTGGTQTSGGTYGRSGYTTGAGSFGYGAQSNPSGAGGGGGGGYYGGGTGWGRAGGAGSSFISGYAGVNAISSASDTANPRTHNDTVLHNSNKYFVNNIMTTADSTGNGKAKITYVGNDAPSRINTNLNNVRYIKDCIAGNTTNGWNAWLEIQAIQNGTNILKGITPTGIANNNTNEDLSKMTDGKINLGNYTNSNAGNTYTYECATLDIGSAQNLDEVAVWHYYSDGRKYYNTETYVSSDNSNWTEIIRDNDIETANGKRSSAYKEYATVTYYANNFGAAASGTTSGVTYTYNAETSELTLNGTFSTQTLLLGNITGMAFEPGDRYTTKMTYVSGSYTTTSTDVGILTDLTVDDTRFSDRGTDPRTYIYVRCPSSGANSKILTVGGSRTTANGMHFRLYQTTANTTTFNNYKIKVEVVKDDVVIIPVGEKYVLPNNPIRYDQTFNGWYTESDGGTQIKNNTVVITGGNQTLYANWGNNKIYSITYDLNGGNVATSNPTNYKVNSSLITLNNPTKTGNTFRGWTEQIVNLDWEEGFINVNTGEIGTSSTYPNSYYSEFVSLKSGVTYTIDTDYSGEFRWRVYDTNEVYLENISGTTYTPSQNVKVRLLFYQGPTSAQMNNTVINAGTQLTTQTIPTDSMGDKHFIANWTPNTYTINYYQGNGTSTAGLTKIGSSTCTYGQSCTLKTYANLGATFPESSSDNNTSSNTCDHYWTFNAWSTSQTGTTTAYTNGQTFTYNLTNNLNLYATGYKYYYFSVGVAPTSYATGYSMYQLWNPYSTSTNYMTSITIPSGTAINTWTFVGYKAGNSDATSGTTYAASTVGTSVKPAYDTCRFMRSLYSRTLTINYQANGGSGTTAATTATQYYNSGYASGGTNYGAKVSTPSFTLRANGFTAPSGYSFSKWADGSTSGTKYAAGATYTAWTPAVGTTTVTKNMYAIWTGNTYTINYYQGNGTSTAGTTKIGSSTCKYGSSCTLTTYANLGATFPESSSANNTSTNYSGCDHYWSFNRWNTDYTKATSGTTYTNGETFTYNTVGNLDLYAVGRKTWYFYSGANPTTPTQTLYQYWNPYSTSTTYMTTVTIPEPTAINTWSFVGYRAGNNTAGSTITIAANKVNSAIKPDYDVCRYARGVYSRTLTINYQANGGSGSTTASTAAQYYNTGTSNSGANSGGNVSTPSFTLRSNGFTAPSGKIFSKWADGSTSGTQYTAGATYTAWAPAVGTSTVTKNMYAIWISQFSFSYTGKYKVCYGTNYGTCTSERTNNSYEISSKPWKVNFLTSGTLTVSGINGKVDAFLVGGGGGGGAGPSWTYEYTWGCSGGVCQISLLDVYAGGSGGGGGNTNTKTGVTLSTTTYTITIGAGGAGSSNGSRGSTGGTTSAFGYSATGGTGGLTWDSPGTGTGAGGNGAATANGTAGEDGVYAFGNSSVDSTKYGAGGGGGASTDAGNGRSRGDGGASGGGAGGTFNNVGNNGTANTGGGAGGGGGKSNSTYSQSGGTGGSGIVIIKNNS